MNLKVLEQKDNPILSRKEITADLTFEGAIPSNEQVKDKLTSEVKGNGKLVVVKKIKTSFGFQKAKVLAYLYENEQKMKMNEPKVHRKQVEKLKKQEAKKTPENKE